MSKGFYAFIAVNPEKNGFRTDLATPGEDDLYVFLRTIAASASLGRYRTFDMDLESPTCGYHLFESGFVKIATVIL